uniref:Zinc finger GRF-type domain-containing protein n=1 Tax=Triticum urartu TaxID=4572 RepID=A0A8R7UIN0_TRIUA
MSSSSSIRSRLFGRLVSVPLTDFPDCGDAVKFYRSSTDEHDGWVFYKCSKHSVTCDVWRWELEYVEHLVATRVLIGDAAIDAIGAAEDRGENLRGRGVNQWKEEA